MPPSEIFRICSTVAIVQFLCNVTANWLVFSRKGYGSALERFDQATRAKERADRAGPDGPTGKGQKSDKRAKRAKKLEEDYRTAAAIVSGMHLFPNIITSVVFFILLRIFGTEMKGSVVGILPFKPFSLLRRLTGRGLDFSNAASFESTSPSVTDVEQACSFMFIYALSTLSIKFYVNKMFGTPTPAGVESLASFLDTPTSAAEVDTTAKVDTTPKIKTV